MTEFERIGREPYINLVTFKRDGNGAETPVWHVELQGRLYVFTDGTSLKVKRLTRNPDVRIALCDWRGGVEGPWIDTRAEVLDDLDKAEEERVYATLQAKYSWQMTLLNLVSTMSGRIHRRVIIEIAPPAH